MITSASWGPHVWYSAKGEVRGNSDDPLHLLPNRPSPLPSNELPTAKGMYEGQDCESSTYIIPGGGLIALSRLQFTFLERSPANISLISCDPPFPPVRL